MIEVEMKLALTPDALPRIEQLLAKTQLLRSMRNFDIYYDTPEYGLLRQAVFVRVRNNWSLEFKFNEQASVERMQIVERAFSLRPEPNKLHEMNTLFSRFIPCWQAVDSVEEAPGRNGLVPLARIENKRAQYVWDNLLLSVDRVQGLGNFLEIEMQCEEGSDTRRAEEKVQRLAADFASRPIHIGYVELWLQKHNPRAYRYGKYQQA